MYSSPIKLNKGYQPKAPINRGGSSIFDIARGVIGFNQLTELVREVDKLRAELIGMINTKRIEVSEKIDEIVSKKEREANERIRRIKIEHQGIPGKDAPPVDEKEIENRVLSRIRQPKDGETPVIDEEKIVRKVLKSIPKPSDGKDAVVNTDEIVNKILEYFEEGKVKLAIKHIKGLENEFMTQRSYARLGGSSGGGIAAGDIHIETPTGAIDSSNTTYTVLFPINKIINFAINGQHLHLTTDYTFSSKTITFVTALDSSLNGKPFQITYV